MGSARKQQGKPCPGVPLLGAHVSTAGGIGMAINHLKYYAGWTDKYAQLFSSVNPVASSHFNFTTPEPTGPTR